MQFQFADGLVVLKELLVRNQPTETYRGEERVLVVLTELRRTVVTTCYGSHVSVVVVVSQTEEVRVHCPLVVVAAYRWLLSTCTEVVESVVVVHKLRVRSAEVCVLASLPRSTCHCVEVMLVEVLNISKVGLLLPVERVAVACRCRAVGAHIDNLVRLERSVALATAVVVVDTNLSLQVKTLEKVECKSCVTEDLSVVRHRLNTLENLYGVTYTLGLESLIATRRIVLVLQNGSSSNHVVLHVLAVKRNGEERNLLNHSTQSALAVGVV